MPTAPIRVIGRYQQYGSKLDGLHVAIPHEWLDILALILYSNPIFANSVLFDVSSFQSSQERSGVTAFYVFSVPALESRLTLFFKSKLSSYTRQPRVVSIERLFKAASWFERESSELFGNFFFCKSNNRKLITDYFFKSYPLLKWVPSVGFSELYVSAEGFFSTRPVKVLNSTLS